MQISTLLGRERGFQMGNAKALGRWCLRSNAVLQNHTLTFCETWRNDMASMTLCETNLGWSLTLRVADSTPAWEKHCRTGRLNGATTVTFLATLRAFL